MQAPQVQYHDDHTTGRVQTEGGKENQGVGARCFKLRVGKGRAKIQSSDHPGQGQRARANRDLLPATHTPVTR
eukprot:2951802-Rhodomonas_salina.1